MFQRFFDEGLAQSSFLLACPRTRQAAVIDPRRDVDAYVEAARRRALRIEWAIETHIHADFVSGSRELAACGAVIVAGPGAGLRFEHHEAHDRERLQMGDVALELLHTPGHTPEHLSIVASMPEGPVRVFTGDTLFVGAVGRPDLLGEDLTRRLAAELYDSLTGTLLSLGDDVEVHPGHGAGSLCGAGIGSDPFSTIGQERRFNPMLQYRSKDEFVAAVLADLPETPSYFPRMKRVNHEGPDVLGLLEEVAPPPALDVHAAAGEIRCGALLLDLRAPDAFVAGHPSDAVNVGYGSKIGYWAGWVVPAGTPLVLLLEGGAREALEARRQLLRVGLDSIAGYVDGGYAAWTSAALPVAHTRQISAREVLAHIGLVTVVDVRTRNEWELGHLEGSLNIPAGEIAARVDEIPRSRPVALICESGQRSALAASLLERAGFSDVEHVGGGMTLVRQCL
jgi:hydroxyacylglutathione hydrolase